MKKFYRQSLFTFSVAIVAIALHVHVISAHTQFHLSHTKKIDHETWIMASDALLELSQYERKQSKLNQSLQVQSYELVRPQQQSLDKTSEVKVRSASTEPTIETQVSSTKKIETSFEIKNNVNAKYVQLSKPTLNTRDIGQHYGYRVDTAKIAETV